MLKTYPESAHSLSLSNLCKYIYGGRGVVTLKSPSGTQHSYAFRKPLEGDEFPPDVVFVYAVHDRSKLFYLGMIEDGRFRLTRNSRYGDHTEIIKGARYLMRMINNPDFETPMEVSHEGMCAVCGRQLITEKSRALGIGPRCNKYLKDHVI